MGHKTKEDRIEYQRAYYIANKGRLNKKSKEWREFNHDRARELVSNWRKANPKRANPKKNRSKENERRKSQRSRDFLRDVYIRRLLTDGTALKPKDVPYVLVEAHRELVKLKRVINEKL